jgi:hypothetical protein
MIGIPSSISFVIHIGILLVKGLFSIPKIFQPRFIKTGLIMLMVGIFSVLTLFSILRLDASTENNFEYLSGLLGSCPSSERTVSKKNVIIRIDDIQGNVWTDISINMVQDSLEKSIPVTLGIIPKDVNKDTKLTSFIEKHNCSLEIAQHGWDHQAQGKYSSPEFAELSYDEAKSRIKKGKKELEKITYKDITTFVPPQNTLNEESNRALHDTGFTIISAEGDKYFDYNISPYDWVQKELLPVEDVITKCEKVFETTNLCVVMVHPQDYTTGGFFDIEKYQEYKNMLSLMQEQGYNFTTFQDYMKPSQIDQNTLTSRISNISNILFKNGFFVVMAIIATLWFGILSFKNLLKKSK